MERSDDEVQAKVGTETFTDLSWNGIVSRVVSRYGLSGHVDATKRVAAARKLENGQPARLTLLVTIHPVRS